MRRNRVGTEKEQLWNWRVEGLSQKHGPLAIQEHIQELIRADPADTRRIMAMPKEVQHNCWLYEHLRQFLIELNLLVTQLKNVCSCKKMNCQNDWFYLCAAHQGKQQDCSAYDYMV